MNQVDRMLKEIGEYKDSSVNADLTFPKSAEVKFPTTAVAAISRFQ
jgi:hypothetical protein